MAAAFLLLSSVLSAVPATATAAVTATPAAARAPAAAADQDWPMFLQNEQRTAATTDANLSVANAPTLVRRLKVATGGPVATSVTVVGTTAYVGSWDGDEYAVNVNTGATLWKQNLGVDHDPGCDPVDNGVTSSAAVVNGVLYVGGGGPYWYALNPATGAVRWKVYTGDNTQAGGYYNWASPLIVGNYAYVGIASNCDNPLVQGQLLQVGIAGAQQGTIVNTYDFVPNGQVGGGVWTTPTYDASTNTVFVSTGTLNDHTQTQSQAIVALDAGTLHYKDSWQLPFEVAVLDSDWGTTPTLTTDAAGDKLLSVANKNGILYTFQRNNLAAGPIWQRQIAIGGDCPTCGDGTIASGIFANGTLYYAGGSNVQGQVGAGGSITAFEPGSGKVLWLRRTEQPVMGSPAYVNGMIGETEGDTFEVLNAADGTVLYSYKLPAPVYGAVSVAHGQFFVGDTDNNVYSFGLPAAAPPPPADPNCPAGFTCRDVGGATVAGSEQNTGGTLTVTAAGAAVHGAADQFRLLAKPVSGDFQSSAEVLTQSSQNAQPEAGVIARQSADPTSPYYAVLASPNDLADGNPRADLMIWYRTAFGAAAVNLGKVYPADKPLFLMVQRTGNSFSAGYSTDGVHYRLIPGTTVDIDMPATTLGGLAVDSGAAANTGTAAFSTLSIGVARTSVLTPTPPAGPCPASWTCTDVGNPNPVGDTTAGGAGSFTLRGAGTGVTTGTADSFHYAYQQVTGNQTLSAQVVTQAGGPANAQQGIMMRAGAGPTAPYYSVTLNPGGTGTVQWRSYDAVPNRTGTLALPTVRSPAYVEIVRYQDTSLTPPQTFFSTLTSTDGVTWTPVLGSTAAIDMGTGSYLAGMAATAGAAGATPAVTYNHVSLTATATEPPGVCPDEFSCVDVGTDILRGNQVYQSPQQGGGTAGTWTIQGGGSDIWADFDNFRFIYQDFPEDTANSANGDGTVSARVVSQPDPGGPWMKTGVMIRAGGTDAQAPYYGVFVTPQHGVIVQWRTARAAQSSQLAVPGTAPLWVLASRFTDTAHGVVYYTASTSTDGSTFTVVPGSTVALALPGPLVAGIATDSYNDTVRATATVDNFAQLPGSQAPAALCPAAWTCTDVGGALPPGQDQLTAGRWNEVAGGGDIWDTADAFHLVAQTLAADGTVSAHVTAQQNTDPWAKAGVMMRASTDPGSPYYGVFDTPGNGTVVQWRTVQGGTSSQQVVAGAPAAFLRVGRYTAGGSTSYTAYTSTDGVTWTAIPGSTVTLGMTGAVQAGIAITSHDQGVGSAVTLDSVAVAAGEPVPPGACPTGWTCKDVGDVTPSPGSQNDVAGTWTIQGGGGDIWAASDSFHYVWQALAADGGVSARVATQTNSDPYAKAGVMVRGSADPGAPYFAIFVTPGHGLIVQSRDAAGHIAVEETSTTGTVPVFVKVVRAGTTFTAQTSTNGTTWVAVPGSAATLPGLTGPLLAGLAVTSHNTGLLSTATFDSVVVGP